MKTGEGTAALEKALDVLQAIGASASGISQSELAERVPLPAPRFTASSLRW